MIYKALFLAILVFYLTNRNVEASPKHKGSVNLPPSSYYSDFDSSDEGPTRGDLGGKRKKRDIEGRIVGGATVDIQQFPFIISLSYVNETNQREHICGGSILSPNIILTAAHCSYGFPKQWTSTYKVRVGSSSSVEGGKLIDIDQIINHEDYYDVLEGHDVSILVLKESIEFSDKAQTIPIATERRNAGSVAVVSGWGYTVEDLGIPSEELRFVNVPVMDNKKCSEYYGSQYKSDSAMLCAGYANGGQDACTTDSGGPLVQGGELIGVVSWGLGCARASAPGVYADVLSMADWIKEKLELYSV